MTVSKNEPTIPTHRYTRWAMISMESVGAITGRSGVSCVPGVGGGEVETVYFWADV